MVAIINVEEGKGTVVPPSDLAAPAEATAAVLTAAPATPKLSEAHRNFIIYRYLSLKTTSLIIGWISLVVSIVFALAQVFICLGKTGMFNGTFIDTPPSKYAIVDPDAHTHAVIDAVVSLLVGSASVSINAFLLVGIYKTSHWYMLPWLIIKGLSYMGGLFYTTVAIIRNDSLSTESMFELFIVVFAQVLGIYAYYVVFVYFKTLKKINDYKKQKFQKLQEDNTQIL